MNFMSSGRRQERHAISGDVSLRQRGGTRYPASIKDVSTGGCRVELSQVMNVGDLMFIRLPGLETLQGTIRWTDGWVAGVEFDTPMHPSVLDMVEERIRSKRGN